MNIVVMFPYPSSDGLHIGHYYNYAIMDTYCRWLRYNGEVVSQPFGYDSFGLPAENYARKIGGDPREITYQNIDNFRKQMLSMNTTYDEKLITSDQSYYKWTQWLFLLLKEKGLAYKAEGVVNFCPSCATTLANEQVKEEKCERCGTLVEQKTLNQWYFRITDYRDRLIKNLDSLDYPEGTKKLQRKWLMELRDWCVSRQRKWGCPIPVEGEEDTLDTFVDSSFYYLRYLTESETEFLPQGSYKPVDLYVGGPEHACMHLIYARFIHMFLFDQGIVPQEEPFNKVFHQGMITKDGYKMSKSRGNVVSPNDFDPDELRMALMFVGPYSQGGDWSDRSIMGITKFFGKLRRWLANTGSDSPDLSLLQEKLNTLVIDMKFNLCVSTFMIFYNENKNKNLTSECRDKFLELFTNFSPSFSGPV